MDIVIRDEDKRYFWIRVFDYDPVRDNGEKGTMLDEFYLDSVTTRDEAKMKVRERYPNTSVGFAKSKKAPGVYAIVMDSDKFFYDRFYTIIDTLCFICHKPIAGHAKDFPRSNALRKSDDDSEFGSETIYFCTYDCKQHFHYALNPIHEGEFQEKETGESGNIFGYIYHIYNRVTNQHYVGQTRYLPFFRWQEHVKDGSKGDVTDLVFETLCEVRKDRTVSENENQQQLNSMEAWWIQKFIEEGYEVMNVTKPRITLESLQQRFNEMVARQAQLTFDQV